jgi:hypothetical protein
MAMNNQKNILIVWMIWHFYEMPKFLVGVWRNYLMFATNFFSAPLLLKTFFDPWKRYNWQYPKGFNAVEFANTLISNTFSRIIGAILRTVLIIIGIIFQIFVLLSGLIIILGWVLMPIIIIWGFILVLTR